MKIIDQTASEKTLTETSEKKQQVKYSKDNKIKQFDLSIQTYVQKRSPKT
jgi:hypothetical protein